MGKIGLATLCILCVSSCSPSSNATDGGGAGGGSGGGGGNGACAGTLKDCGGVCRDPLADPANCGACGTICGAGMVCNKGTCAALPDDCVAAGGCAPGYFCEPTTKKCGVGCRLPTECPTSATCEMAVCKCPSGQHICGQSCVSDNNPASCGTSCAACPNRPNGVGVCTNATCELQCNPGYVRVAGNCEAVGSYKPNVMFLIDRSGSMNFAANDQVAPCTPGCNTGGKPACVAGCPTRLQALKSAMPAFVSAHGTSAWMGMALYPTAPSGSIDACGATGSGDIRAPLAPKKTDLSADLTAAAMAVNAEIQAVLVGGGTPTGNSLRFLGAYPPLADPDPTAPRRDFVVLITDGVPNCNANNPNDCTNATACRCTLAPATACMPNSFCTLGCLDKDNSVGAITALRAKGIRTIVIGFGADTASDDGPDVLSAMGEAGGVPRTCPNQTDAECGVGHTCTTATRICSSKFYQATTSAELTAALADAMRSLPP